VKRLVRAVLGRSPKPCDPTARPRLLLFDFDGTIADTFGAGFEILNRLAGEFRFRPLREEHLERARDMRTRELMRFLGIPLHKMSRIAQRGTEELHSRMPSIQPLPGMPDLLRQLHGEGFRLGIVTSNSEANVRVFLERHDLDFFEFIRSSSKLLGKAHEIRMTLKALKLRPDDVFFIGDETRDIEASQKAGIRIAAVTWGYNSARSLESLRPTHLFAGPADLGEMLRQLGRPPA
jgi:HAD superfamily hydrolase (TIGR01549 family)